MAKRSATYELIYWPGIPGRGEHIRLAFEEAGIKYTDTAYSKDSFKALHTGGELNSPIWAPPILKHGDLVISQTPNILLYLGPQLGLAGGKEGKGGDDAVYRVNALALTALDGLSNEVHDCHHPIATRLNYEDQKVESLRRTKEFVKNRLPLFLEYFERVIKNNLQRNSGTPWLYGEQLTWADLVLFQCVDGCKFAFPKAMGRMEESGEYQGVWGLYEAVKGRENIKAYLTSKRRQKYSMGIYRYYEELDVVE